MSYSPIILCSDLAYYRGSFQDVDGSVPFFWGIDADENLVLSDDTDIVSKSCGKSYAPFPKGSSMIYFPPQHKKKDSMCSTR